jgi:serine/threonine protein phosphatase PrpC
MKVNMTSFGFARSEKNESQDSFGVKSWGETVIAVVADGVGTARDGREASSRIVQSLVSNYEARPKTWSPQRALTEFTKLINSTLYRESLSRYDSPEMVSTLAAAVIEGDRLYGLNVGDSRVYVARNGNLTRLSNDHVADDGEFKHVLNRAIGLGPEVEPHCFEMNLADGDIALLCSDGVSNVLSDDDLETKLAHGASARSIVSSAKERATPETLDDMSAVVVDIARTGKLRAVRELPLEIPGSLHRGGVIDGFTLVKPFQHSDRVWLATRDGQRFTLKFAPAEARDNETVLDLFVKETWNATRIDADFFPKAFVPENAATRCYAMEFVEAPSLKMLLQSRRLAVDEAISLGKFLLNASQYLLHFDLVHGDIKPENILVCTDYDKLSFKLVDFGSATEIFSVTSRAGTASYLAPERFHEAPISERTEIYAIGATLFQSLTGVLPYGEIERFQTPEFASPKLPCRLNANIPHWLESALLRAVSPDPELRYKNYSELMFDLEHPGKVEPYHPKVTSLKKTLLFYKIGFYVLLAVTLFLLMKLLIHWHG